MPRILRALIPLLFAVSTASSQEIRGPDAIPEHTVARYTLDVAVPGDQGVLVIWTIPEALSPEFDDRDVILTGPPGSYLLRATALVGDRVVDAKQHNVRFPLVILGRGPAPIPPVDPDPIDPDPVTPSPQISELAEIARAMLREMPQSYGPDLAESYRLAADDVAQPAVSGIVSADQVEARVDALFARNSALRAEVKRRAAEALAVRINALTSPHLDPTLTTITNPQGYARAMRDVAAAIQEASDARDR